MTDPTAKDVDAYINAAPEAVRPILRQLRQAIRAAVPDAEEKISYGMALLILFAQHRLPLSVLAIGSVDWIFAALFIAAYVATRPDHAVGGSRS